MGVYLGTVGHYAARQPAFGNIAHYAQTAVTGGGRVVNNCGVATLKTVLANLGFNFESSVIHQGLEGLVERIRSSGLATFSRDTIDVLQQAFGNSWHNIEVDLQGKNPGVVLDTHSSGLTFGDVFLLAEQGIRTQLVRLGAEGKADMMRALLAGKPVIIGDKDVQQHSLALIFKNGCLFLSDPLRPTAQALTLTEGQRLLERLTEKSFAIIVQQVVS